MKRLIYDNRFFPLKLNQIRDLFIGKMVACTEAILDLLPYSELNVHKYTKVYCSVDIWNVFSFAVFLIWHWYGLCWKWKTNSPNFVPLTLQSNSLKHIYLKSIYAIVIHSLKLIIVLILCENNIAHIFTNSQHILTKCFPFSTRYRVNYGL